MERPFTKIIGGLLILFPLLLGMDACRKESRRGLILAAYTAPREAFREINGLFENKWRKEKGEAIRIKESYLSSGAQSRAVVDGFEADVVALALEVDVDRLAEVGLITQPWREGPNGGILTESIVAFAVRSGNPHGVNDWRDLLKEGLEVLTPNPKTSGGAQWNVLAAYGAADRGMVEGFPSGKAGAIQFLRRLLKQVTAMDKGARESILTFERGVGDVALSYENEIREGQAHGNSYELILPRSTIQIQNPVALVDKNVAIHKNRDITEAYLSFLFSPEAQKIFAKHGFRPVNPEAKKLFKGKFSPVQDLFTIEDLGGWKKVMPEFFGAKGIFTEATEQ
jgi:sulfate transport system substrate-binding protein